MEEHDRGGVGLNRRSPRVAVRKVAARMASNTSTEESAGVTVNKKRKRRGNQPVPVLTKQGNQGSGPSKKKQIISWKCCPQMLYDLIESLSPIQKKWVEELGFGCLLLMKEVRIPKILTLWLINQVDCKKKCLVIRGKRFKIYEWVARALGAPKGDLKVPLPRSGRGKSKIRNPTEEEKEFRAADGGRGIKVKDAINALIAENEVSKFKRQFMLVVLCLYFAPTSSHFINRSYRAPLVNIDQVKDMDWCEFIANYLVDGIRDYLESPATNVNVHGCVHLLPLMYICIVHSQQLQVPNESPLIQCVSTELLELLESLDMQHDEYGEPTFGNLEIKPELQGDGISDCSENDSHRKAPRLIRQPQAQMKSKLAARERAPMDNNSQAARRSSYSPKRPKRDSKAIGKMAMATTIDEVESEYTLERAKVYQRCLDLLNKRVAKLDMRRKSAMLRLMNKNGKVESSNPSIAVSTDRVTVEASKVVSAQQHPLNVKDSTDVESLKSCYEAERTSLVGSPSAVHTIAVQDQTPGVLSENNHIGVHNELHNTSSSDGHSSQLVVYIPPHQMSPIILQTSNNVCYAADGASTEVITSSDVPNNSANLPPHVDTVEPISGQAVQNEVSDGENLSAEKNHMSSAGDTNGTEKITDVVGSLGQDEVASTHRGDDVLEEVVLLAVEASSEALQIAHNEASNVCTDESNVAENSTEQTPGVVHTTSGSDVNNLPEENKQDQDVAPHGPEELDRNIVSDNQQEGVPQDGLIQTVSAGSEMAASDNIWQCLDTKLVDDHAEISLDIASSDEATDVNTKLFISPTYTFEELEVNESPQTPLPVVPADIQNLTPLTSAIPEGQFFPKARSVNTAVKTRPKRIQKNESKVEGISACVRYPMKDKVAAGRTYTEHVEKSSRLAGEEQTGCINPESANATKIRIRGFHISESEFVQALIPNGAISENFMWLCCVAIMEDWGSRTKIILNQTIVNELKKSTENCNLEDLTRRLRKLPLKGVEQIYIPVPYDCQWILIVVSVVGKTVEIYDSMRSVDKGEEPYKTLWATMGQNLQDTLSQATGQETPVYEKYSIVCAQIPTQPNAADSGLEVIRALDCHNGKTLIGYGKKNMLAYRKQIAHTLV